MHLQGICPSAPTSLLCHCPLSVS